MTSIYLLISYVTIVALIGKRFFDIFIKAQKIDLGLFLILLLSLTNLIVILVKNKEIQNK